MTQSDYIVHVLTHLARPGATNPAEVAEIVDLIYTPALALIQEAKAKAKAYLQRHGTEIWALAYCHGLRLQARREANLLLLAQVEALNA